MGGAGEECVKAAMIDDTMVVDLLVRLHTTAPSPPLPTLPLGWTVRQRRSKPLTINAHKPPRTRSQRASPSTPFSWSGGDSGGSGASEESTRPHIQNISVSSRSKINGDSNNAIAKRSRKKKTLAELQDDENSLLKEKRLLKREIAALHLNLEIHRAKNEKLKRIKVELQHPPNRETADTHSTSAFYPASMLPDLNMPCIDPVPDVVCRVS